LAISEFRFVWRQLSAVRDDHAQLSKAKGARQGDEAQEERATQRIWRAALIVVGLNLTALSIAVAVLLSYA
jgi:hypothetical protein